MEKIWLKSYPPGIPAEINPDSYRSLIEVFEKSCHDHHDLPAFYSLGKILTYSEMELYTREFAAYLQQKLKLKKGSRFAIMLPNLLQYPIAMFGAMRAGLIIVNVNPLYTADELIYQLNDSEAETIIVLENFASTLEKALPKIPSLKNVIVTQIGDLLNPLKGWWIHLLLKYIFRKVPKWHIPANISFKKIVKESRHLPFSPVQLENQDIAFLQYTGGTTGVSKGAILTHRNLISNLMQADAWFKNEFTEKKEIILTALPLYHIFSLTANCLYFFKIGGLNVLIANPRRVRSMIHDMQKFRITVITGVNTLFALLIKEPKFRKVNFTAMRLTLGGGMAVQKMIAEKWEAITHAPLLEAYGLTETSPCVSMNPTTIKHFNGTVGLPVSSTDVCILDENGHETKIGEAGELAVKGPQVMQGYWHNAKETKKVFNADGWLLTGDIASINEQGFLRILERKKDMILVSGFNVYPNEIEEIIAKHPGVREVAVIGVKDPKSGEVVKAMIVKENPDLTKNDVIEFCRQHMTAYKVPKEVEFCDDLPKTNVGKVLRRALKETQHS